MLVQVIPTIANFKPATRKSAPSIVTIYDELRLSLYFHDYLQCQRQSYRLSMLPTNLNNVKDIVRVALRRPSFH